MKKTGLMPMLGLALLGAETFMTGFDDYYSDHRKPWYKVRINKSYKTGANQRKKRKLNHWANKKVN